MRTDVIKGIVLGFVFGLAALLGATQVTNAQIRIYTDTGRYDRDDDDWNDRREILRQAVVRGYQQGFRQGQIDRRYGRRMDYDDSGMYHDGSYGYNRGYNRGYEGGMRNRYQRAFQRGFERGYEDGYYSRYRYGYRTNNGVQVLGSILNSIINASRY